MHRALPMPLTSGRTCAYPSNKLKPFVLTMTKSKKARRDYEADLVAGLITLMEAGTNPWQKEWTSSSDGQHRNMVNGHIYSGGNPALLELQMAIRGVDCPLWIPSGAGAKKGWYPKKGSKACCILRPFHVDREVTDSDGKPVLDDQGNAERVQFTSFYYTGRIFNAMDMDGEGLADAIKAASNLNEMDRTEPERHEAAEQLLGNWEVPVTFQGNRAYYTPSADRIQLPAREDFSSSAGLYATWAHEAIHSTGHKKRLEREGIVSSDATFGSELYAKEELVAELGAFLLCNRLQISSKPDNHASYLQSWIRCLKEEPAFLKKSIGDATKAANLLFPQVHEAVQEKTLSPA